MRHPAQLTSIHRRQLMLVAKAVQEGKPLHQACRFYHVPDVVARRWRQEMGLSPRLTAPLKLEDVQPAVARWLEANAADKSVCAPVS